MNAVSDLTFQVGVGVACQALGIPRSSFYRSRYEPRLKIATTAPPTPSPRALIKEEQSVVRETLNSPRFAEWTMYRILNEHQEVRERCNQLRHPNHPKPELVATAPNQLWSWDITRLLGPTKGTYYQLYVIIDVFSRYVSGWLLADRESANLAKRLVRET